MAVETKPTIERAKVQGNTFSMLGMARVALRKAGYDPAQLEAFMNEATSGTPTHMLETIREHCIVE
jgi:hypothetical protein